MDLKVPKDWITIIGYSVVSVLVLKFWLTWLTLVWVCLSLRCHRRHWRYFSWRDRVAISRSEDWGYVWSVVWVERRDCCIYQLFSSTQTPSGSSRRRESASQGRWRAFWDFTTVDEMWKATWTIEHWTPATNSDFISLNTWRNASRLFIIQCVHIWL